MFCYFIFLISFFFHCTVFNLISPASPPPPPAPPPIWPINLNRPTRSLFSGVLHNLIPFKASHKARYFYFNWLERYGAI
jgi:hypothetical protein